MSKKDPRVPANYASLAGRMMAEARWQGTTAAERSAQALEHGRSGRPRQDKRCFCGQNSMWRACSRNFDCCRKAGRITLQLKKRQDSNDDQQSADAIEEHREPRASRDQ